ncbi:MAG: hypothetical protein B7Z55_10520, partial [Planctomycetales bacterium 12-60-4]
WHAFGPVGWIMSIEPADMNDDGHVDILYSDRKGPQRGIHWLENPGRRTQDWMRHTIGGADREVMFLSEGDLDGDRRKDIVCAVRGGDILWLRRLSVDGVQWSSHAIAMPDNAGSGKGVAICDVDNDFHADVVFTCESAGGKHGVGWLSPSQDPTARDWSFHTISGDREGVKFDLIQLLDLDEDGDYDVLTCEERDNLGVIWYENPSASSRPADGPRQ